MDIKHLIISKIKNNKKVTVSEITKETGFSRVYIHRFFKSFVEEGLIVKVGHANRAVYVLATDSSIKEAKQSILFFNRTFKIRGIEEDQVFNLIKKETGIFEDISANVCRIVEYAFTEMLNNAMEHSKSEDVKIMMKRENGLIRFDVIDKGIGIFENIIHARHLRSVEEAIQDLLRGKQTTLPEEHSGEGIFFTRRAGDIFIIKSSQKELFFDNKIDDFTIMTIKPVLGTRVIFTISEKSSKNLSDIFKNYTNESYEFSTTEVMVRLYREGGSRVFVSRSQAKRILYGLDIFKIIILDFKDIDAIGQGFADEIFRVWQKSHKNIDIRIINTNEDIEFMIRRAKE